MWQTYMSLCLQYKVSSTESMQVLTRRGGFTYWIMEKHLVFQCGLKMDWPFSAAHWGQSTCPEAPTARLVSCAIGGTQVASDRRINTSGRSLRFNDSWGSLGWVGGSVSEDCFLSAPQILKENRWVAVWVVSDRRSYCPSHEIFRKYLNLYP